MALRSTRSAVPPAIPPVPPSGDPAVQLMRGMQNAADRMEMAAQAVSTVLVEARVQASNDIRAGLMAELPFAIDRLVVQRQRRMVVGAVVAAVVACGGAGAAGWWLRGGPPAVTCGEQTGGVVCWYWLQAPSAATAPHR